ncbi:MAG TPA: hypothetical protein VF494_01075 [Candidatus Limnocylindrales bacterium]
MSRLAGFLLAAVVAGCVTQASLQPSLQIATRPALSPAPGQAEVCMQALFDPVIIGRQGDKLTFTSVDTGQEVDLVWPHGFSATVVAGKGELLDSSGVVIGREGDTLSNLGGGGDQVCSIGTHIYSDRVGVANP